MILSKQKISTEIRSKLNQMNGHLSLRVHSLLDEIAKEDMAGADEVELFDLLVQLILNADKEPASMIANLMVPLNNEGASQLEDWTLSNSGAFLKDYLKKDYILYVLRAEKRIG